MKATIINLNIKTHIQKDAFSVVSAENVSTNTADSKAVFHNNESGQNQTNINSLSKDYAQAWHKLDWKTINEKVAILQNQIVLESIKGNKSQVMKLQRKLICSLAGRAKAVRKVVTNKGGKTPGIDRIIWKGPAQYYEAIIRLSKIVQNPYEYKAKPLKRVLIPKPGSKTGETRPLGIPTLDDRMVQAVYHLAIDPIVEQNSDINSFGFRKFRSTQDAVNYLRNYLDKSYSPRWVLEADISKCFDKIDHNFLLNHTPICDKHILKEWLKCGVLAERIWKSTDEGTPQGGIISPTLCNIALNGLEKVIKEVRGRSSTGHSPLIKIIRYADDIVITGKDKTMLEECKQQLREFLIVRGLTLNEEKTKIVNIEEGIDFLGFNIRRQPWNFYKNVVTEQKDVLVIKPSKKGLTKLLMKIKDTITQHRNITDIANALNPVLRGWAEHKRISPQARQAFFKIDNYIWERLRAQLIRSRSGKSIVKDNFSKVYDKDRRWGDDKGVKILSLARIGIHRLRLKKLNLNPYILENIPYFLDQQSKRVESNLKMKIYAKYKQKCVVCNETLHNGEKIEIHHIKAIKEGGTNKLSNMVALHRICHTKVTHEKSEIKVIMS